MIEKILFWWFLIVYIFWISILMIKYDMKIRITPICIWQWFYSFYDNKSKMCKSYVWYWENKQK